MFIIIILDIGEILYSEVVDVSSIFNDLFDCQMDDILFITIDNPSNMVAVSRHHVSNRQFLVHENVLVQLCELLLLIYTQSSSSTALNKTIKSVRNHHLNVEGLVLLQKYILIFYLSFYLSHPSQKFLRQFGILLPILHPIIKISHLVC